LRDRRRLLRAALLSLALTLAGAAIALHETAPVAKITTETGTAQASGSLPRPDGQTFPQRDVARRRALQAAAALERAKLTARVRHAAAVRRARRLAALHRVKVAATHRIHRFSRAVRRVRHRAAVCNRHRRHAVCHAHRTDRMRMTRRALRHARHTLHRVRHTLDHVRRAVIVHRVPRAAHRPARHGGAHREAHHRAARRSAVIRRARHAAARRAAFQLPRRTEPGHVVHGHYLRSLTGRPRDERIMRRLGVADARRNPRGMGHLVLLDIGGQSRHGVRLSIVNRFLSYRALVRAITSYVAGYHSRQRPNAPVTVSLGTNNDLYTSARAGRLWAQRVVNPVRAAARHYADITIAGADDIEPGFSGGPRATRGWLRSFLRHTRAPFVFNGSADGCSWRRPFSHCNHGWTARALARLAGSAAPKRILALPQIYNAEMAGQWAQISRTATRLHHPQLRIVGPLTEQRACGRNPACPSIPSHAAWRLLHHRLHRVGLRPRSLPVQVDLDVR
jgi:hypothetical protein